MEALIRLLPLPEQYSGKEIIVSHSVNTVDSRERNELLHTAIKRLKDVNNWHRLMEENFAVFQLTDETGQRLQGVEPEKGMYFSIDIAGPGSEAGKGYDWVKVTETRHFESGKFTGYFITVHPADNPTVPDGHTAHFYAASASSTFLACSDSDKIYAMVLDRNVEINTDNKHSADAIRNALYGVAGKAAFSRIQWRLLTESLLKKPEET